MSQGLNILEMQTASGFSRTTGANGALNVRGVSSALASGDVPSSGVRVGEYQSGDGFERMTGQGGALNVNLTEVSSPLPLGEGGIRFSPATGLFEVTADGGARWTALALTGGALPMMPSARDAVGVTTIPA